MKRAILVLLTILNVTFFSAQRAEAMACLAPTPFCVFGIAGMVLLPGLSQDAHNRQLEAYAKHGLPALNTGDNDRAVLKGIVLDLKHQEFFLGHESMFAPAYRDLIKLVTNGGEIKYLLGSTTYESFQRRHGRSDWTNVFVKLDKLEVVLMQHLDPALVAHAYGPRALADGSRNMSHYALLADDAIRLWELTWVIPALDKWEAAVPQETAADSSSGIDH